MYPVPPRLDLPLTPYQVDGYRFGQRVRSRLILWARHLGDDCIVPAGTLVRAAGAGQVVYAATRPGSGQRRNWGGLVVLGHTHPVSQASFFSVYGHITDIGVELDQEVAAGQEVGVVAAGLTPENGWWKQPHLHFGIYAGPWHDGEILPGYKRPFDGRTKFRWWRDPQTFMKTYNSL